MRPPTKWGTLHPLLGLDLQRHVNPEGGDAERLPSDDGALGFEYPSWREVRSELNALPLGAASWRE